MEKNRFAEMKVKKLPPETPERNFDFAHGKLFVQKLLHWNKKWNRRIMPWKGEKDPYRIWLSEIILQQTRVEQGLKYYQNFIRTFPDVHALASAPEKQVFKLWEGLGYYSRCSNLIATAKFIAGELGGVFPKDYESILALKGVGAYTAAAIASFAYNLPYAVVDGNVFRVLSRVFDIETPVDSTEGRKQFSELAQGMLPRARSAEYNQAIMDFGALVCKPWPECKTCFFNHQCKAYLNAKQDLLPIKEKKLMIRERWLNYFIVRYKDQVLIRQRTSKDIWNQLYEFVLIETGGAMSQQKLCRLFQEQFSFKDFHPGNSFSTSQRLSHQMIRFYFLEGEIKRKQTAPGFTWIKISELNKYAFPKSLQESVTVLMK